MSDKQRTVPLDKAGFQPWLERLIGTPLHKKQTPKATVNKPLHKS